jgi:IS605 OrfB family transposase
LEQGAAPIVGYQALCRQLTARGPAGELSAVGARSVLGRYSDAWFTAAKRRRKGERAGFPRRKRLLVPVRFYHQTFRLEGQRVRLPVARGRPALWVQLARPLPYPADQVRAVTLVADGGRLWLAVTAAMVSGRAIRAESFLHLRDQQTRQSKTARRAPKPGQHGSRRWRRYRASRRRVESRHRRRVHQAHHQAAGQVVDFAVRHRIGVLVVGDPTGITTHDTGRVHNLRLRQWRRTHLVQTLQDKAEQAGIDVRLVDERGTSSTCAACRR